MRPVTKEYMQISFLESMLTSLSAQNLRNRADAFRGNSKTTETRRCPKT